MDNSDIGVVPGRFISSKRGGPVVLIVEDNPAQAQYIATLIESLGYDFEIATDGSEGLALAQKVRPVLIILDLHMPRFDGAGFLKRFKARGEFADVPVIVATASQSIDTITRVCAMGARDFIAKPIDP